MMEATMGTTLRLRREFDAPRERVFRAWTDPADLRRWYAPVPGWTVSLAEVDLRPGGGYHLEFGPPGGEQVVEKARYVEVDPPARLVCEMALGGAIDGGEQTRIIVEFNDIDGRTEVLIVEEGYSSVEVRDMHEKGWSHALDRLGETLAG